MTIDTSNLGMATWLTLCAAGNAWFICIGIRRCALHKSARNDAKLSASATSQQKEEMQAKARQDSKQKLELDEESKNPSLKQSSHSYLTCQSRLHLLEAALLGMACMDFPWVWFCLFQCWYNVVNNKTGDFSQFTTKEDGEPSFGCVFMGWYSMYSQAAMMASNCAVCFYANYLVFPWTDSLRDGRTRMSFEPGYVDEPGCGRCFWQFLVRSTTSVFILFVAIITPFSLIYGSFPAFGLGGYKLTNGGFCYADFSNQGQAIVLFLMSSLFLSLGGFLWIRFARQAGRPRPGEKVDVQNKSRRGLVNVVSASGMMFICVWGLWPPAGIYGMYEKALIPAPYMIIGGFLGHGQALANPILFGFLLHKIAKEEAEYIASIGEDEDKNILDTWDENSSTRTYRTTRTSPTSSDLDWPA